MDEWNVWRSAEEMIRRYGEFDAVTVCARRQCEFWDRGDRQTAAIWRRIRDAVQALTILSCDCLDHEKERKGIIAR
jgi:hypothetical protein